MGTGQRDLDPGMGGLMDYKARFYSPYINRFIQPDTIVPNPTQGLNKYSYVGNNPINFNDPTGHCRMDAKADDCFMPGRNNPPPVSVQLAQFGISVSENTPAQERLAILTAVILVGERFADARDKGESASEAFKSIYADGININYGGTNASGQCANPEIQSGGCTSSRNQINFWTMSGHNMYDGSYDFTRMVKNVVHELGHAYAWAYKYSSNGINPIDHMGMLPTNRELLLKPNCSFPCRGPQDLAPQYYDWQQHPPAMDAQGWTASETFGDLFIAWTYNAWNLNPDNAQQVQVAQTWMNGWMPHP